LLRH
jgi:hypothetical protein